MFPQNQQKKKQNQYTNDSILESLRNLSTGVGDTLKNQSSQATNDAFSSLFGSFPQSQHEFNQQIPGEYTPERLQKNSFSRPEIVRPPVVKQEEQGLAQKIEAVRSELKALSVSIKKFNAEVDKAVSEVPVHPGIYHLTFLERLRTVIKHLRQNIDNSSMWLSAHSGRKKKMGFWGMYKKHGTTFGLSHERSLATQAG